jgi:hypothetical protein
MLPKHRAAAAIVKRLQAASQLGCCNPSIRVSQQQVTQEETQTHSVFVAARVTNWRRATLSALSTSISPFLIEKEHLWLHLPPVTSCRLT